MGDWAFLTRPDFWFGSLICGVVINIISNVITVRFPQWIARVGGWRGALDLSLLLYAVITALGVLGAAMTAETWHMTPQALAVIALTWLVRRDGKIISKFALALGALIVIVATFFIDPPHAVASSLFVFMYLNLLLLIVAAFTWLVSAALWMWRHDMGRGATD